ncbi:MULTISPECIES: ABC transporter permease [unclassified Variovorax]|uniref:ABC transporter permease n=1 Tax=unclassified Variovorax TaxID=663243 RepID=UPI0013193D49|nr:MULTISPECIES: ABC transporter permease [unclassified Variovorax]VTU14901.1 Dipeptide transport system permease protein DppB [Variovorax sp. SRS16]VTU22319.1 Dipeptide transport system permease protein DppB [Variovorax sp. PBL-E5]
MNQSPAAILGPVLARFAKMAAVIVTVAIFNFFLVHAAPGDPALVIAGQSGSTDEAYMARIRAEYGLDKPIAAQLASYLGKVATLDLGYSYRQQRPVTEVIGERLGPTLLLTGTAFLLSLIGGIALGSLAGVRAGKLSDTLITIVSLVVYATPVFWLGIILVLLFSVRLEWLPAFGYQTVGASLHGMALWLDRAKYLVMPATTLGLLYLAIYARLMRASIIEVSHQDFVKTARAKGASRHRVLWRHMLRNAMLPVLTMAGVQAGTLIGGSVVIETVFAWPGLGRLTYEAVLQRDYQLLLGIFLVMSIVVSVFNLVTDLLYRVVDPRIRSV